MAGIKWPKRKEIRLLHLLVRLTNLNCQFFVQAFLLGQTLVRRGGFRELV